MLQSPYWITLEDSSNWGNGINFFDIPEKIEEECSKEVKATSGRPEEESREVTNTENTGECRPRRERSLKMKIPGEPDTRKRRHIRVEMNEVCACIAQVFVQPITFVPQFPKVHNILLMLYMTNTYLEKYLILLNNVSSKLNPSFAL